MSNFILKTLETRELKLNTIRLRGFYGGKLRKGSGGGGSSDGFPVLPGDVTRWHFGGLTNEMMAAMDDPRIEDADHKGRFLSFKNFAWGGMSGVGGYVDNWNSSADWDINSYWVNSHTDHKLQFIKASSVVQARSNNIYNAENVYKNILNVNGLTEAVNKGSVKALRIIATDPITSKAIKTFSFETDGVIQISFDDVLQDYYVAYFLSGNNTNDIDITIEQLPLYPGALVFDGVDDYGTCNNFPILTKEKGYTVVALRKWLTPETKTINEVLLGNFKNNPIWISANLGAFQFEVKYNVSKKVQTDSFGIGNNITLNNNHLFSYQISNSYNGSILRIGSNDGGNFFTVGCGGDQFYANAAIWELVFLDHDATEEELTKIKDYFVKTYPWLFPDQAWTVVGKTNEDEDRATIANITGNGNDLILSNFGFAEGSGYNEQGEYAGYLVTDGVDDKIVSSVFGMGKDFTIVGDWKLINTGKNDNAGIVKFDSIVIYNYNPILINIKNGRNNLIPDQNTVNAICSDGRIYSKDWKESIYNEETESTSKNLLTIGYSGNIYTKIAFKNLAIYPTVLSKEDCIKAYNYLQTLKAK